MKHLKKFENFDPIPEEDQFTEVNHLDNEDCEDCDENEESMQESRITRLSAQLAASPFTFLSRWQKVFVDHADDHLLDILDQFSDADSSIRLLSKEIRRLRLHERKPSTLRNR